MIDNQFYPTPKLLAKKARKKFQHPVKRLLEPSAGRGDLVQHVMDHTYVDNVDCIEIDLQNQAILRDKGFRVIDGDFMEFKGQGALYSHILMNPPFNRGVDHTLHAWDIMYSGEIVSIINAGNLTRDNPTKKAQMLLDLIQRHGSLEILDEQFTTDDTQRKTNVQVALIYLEKTASLMEDFYTGADLKKEGKLDELDGVNNQQLAIPNSTLQNTVRAFEIAVEKTRQAEIAEDEASYCRRLIWSQLRPEKQPPTEDLGSVQERFNGRYMELKEQAWRTILETTEFTARLSSKAQQRLESQFAEIVVLEFTLSNIFGLLSGLTMQKGQMDVDMQCDVFDEISKYHTDNRAYFMGWKSNDRHRKGCYRIKMTRFILPIGKAEYSFDYYAMQKLHDIDKVFAMLDGKQEIGQGISTILQANFHEARQAVRLKGDYFDVRYFQGTGSLHVFPHRKDLVDRLNRTVGKMRAWLPHEHEEVDPKFWNQYKKAEKVTAKMLSTFKKRSSWQRSYWHEADDDGGKIDVPTLHAQACEALEIPLPVLENDRKDQPALESKGA